MAAPVNSPRIKVRREASSILQANGSYPWTVYGETAVRLVTGTGKHRKTSPLLPLRWDTATFVSALPEEWFRFLSPYLALGDDEIQYATAAGRGAGRLACRVATAFTETPDSEYLFDWLVTPGLNGRGYGLLSLRETLLHFAIEQEGRLELSGEFPIALPILNLIPHSS